VSSRPLAALVVALAAAVPAGGGESQALDRLQALGSALRSQNVWSADYHQEYVPAGMTAGEEAEGTVWVAWPDRALFRIGQPVVRMMGLEGRTVRLLDLEVPSCDEHSLSDEEWARVPLVAVLDPGGAVDRFSILSRGASGLVLKPRQPGGVDRVLIEIGPDSLPLEVVIVDPQGATNRLRFTSWTAAQTPPDGAWLPPAPGGVPCVSDQEMDAEHPGDR
jgi:hypothetical protein